MKNDNYNLETFDSLAVNDIDPISDIGSAMNFTLNEPLSNKVYDLGLTSNVLIGTCIINDCDPCIKVAIGACVKLCKGGTIIAQTSTDACGNYKFTGLEPGVYTVIASRKRLCPKCKQITIGDGFSIYMLHLLLNRDEKNDCCRY